MTGKDIYQALGDIDPRMIEKADNCSADDPKNGLRRRMRYAGGAAACLCLVIALAIGLSSLLIPKTQDGGGSDQMADIFYGFCLNGLQYYPIDVGDHARYEEVKALQVGATGENRYEITEAHLGEWLGTIPADENFGQGEVYRFAAYPDYDAIVIMHRDGEYKFYISDGDLYRYIRETGKSDSDALFSYHGMPDSITEMTTEVGGTPLSKESVAEVITLLSGKQTVEYAVYAERAVALWKQTYGTDEVKLSGSGGLDYDMSDEEIRERLWAMTTPVSLWIKTDRGFDMLLIHYYPQFGVFNFSNQLYGLSESEMQTLDGLLGIE